MKKADYDQWAADLLEEIYYAPQDHRIMIIKEHLLKAHKRGYLDGADNGWWKNQEATLKLSNGCFHESDGNSYLSCPPKSRCVKCGEYF